MRGRSSSRNNKKKYSRNNRNFHPDSVVCDASSLISLTDIGLLGALIKVRPWIKGEFLIPRGVEYEAIDRPLRIKRYSFSGVRLKRALESNIFKLVPAKEITIREILDAANHMLYVAGKPLRLVHKGEAEILASAIDHNLKTLLMDERTTRMYIEDPFTLRDHLSKEFRKKVTLNERNLDAFRKMTGSISVIRSAEILALAYETGYFRKFRELERQAFAAALYAVKFSGCAISFEEIREIVKEVKRQD